jgi:outer membrane protein
LLLDRLKSTRSERGKARALSCFIAAFVAMAFATGSAQASKPLDPQQIAAYQSANETDRVRFLITLAKSGLHEQAAELLKRYPLQGPYAQTRIMFIQGLIQVGRGDLTGGVKTYRDVLAIDPSLTLVRTELAQTLVTLGEDDSAVHHLELLAASAPDPKDAAGIRNFIDKVNAKRPVTFSGYISLAPSTNINNGSSHSTVYSAALDNIGDIDIANRKQSGIGASLGGSIGYAKRLGNYWQAVLAADVDASLYGTSSFDSISFSQSAEMRYHLAQGYVGFGGVANQGLGLSAFDINNPYFNSHSYGPRVSFKYNLTSRDTIDTSALYEWRDYANSSDQDGTAFLSDISLSHAIDSNTVVQLSGGYDKINTNNKVTAYRTIYGGLGVYKELPHGITINAKAQIRASVFDEINPYALYVREDQRYTGAISLTKRDLNIAGFAPALTYTYTLNKSNIALWDYDSHAIDFRLTKDF